MAELWRNRAGNQRALVGAVRPTTEHEVCRIVSEVAERGGHVKAAGAGHSFSDVGLTDGTMVSLEDYGRVLTFDPDAALVTVQAGARLHELSRYLWTRGFALAGLDDLGSRSIAGATSTASHGTGASFPNISAGIAAMRIVDGAGEVHDASPEGDRELFDVGRVGLGALGIVSTVTLKVVPAFNLRTAEEQRRFVDVAGSFPDLVGNNDHFEFVHMPHTPWVLTRTRQRSHEPLRRPHRRFAIPGADRLAGRPASKRRRDFDQAAHEAFATPQRIGYIEMEHAVPLEATMEALEGVRGWIERNGVRSILQIAVRSSAADDIALSNAAARPSGHISVRARRRSAYEACFREVEQILLGHDGRPHWGGIHFRSAADLAAAYPRWDSFQAVRARMDPTGVFENAYTRRCLGPVT